MVSFCQDLAAGSWCVFLFSLGRKQIQYEFRRTMEVMTWHEPWMYDDFFVLFGPWKGLHAMALSRH